MPTETALLSVASSSSTGAALASCLPPFLLTAPHGVSMARRAGIGSSSSRGRMGGAAGPSAPLLEAALELPGWQQRPRGEALAAAAAGLLAVAMVRLHCT